MGDRLAVLGDRSVIEVSGLEARALLQRLITNDVDHLAGGEACYAALLSPQGKITSDFFVVSDPADSQKFLIDVAEALAADLTKKLTLYRLRAKVEIIDRSSEFGVFAMAAGDEAAPDAALRYADPRDPALWGRGIAPKSALADLGDDAGRWAYREARIKAGVPEGGLDFAYGEAFPHDANLDRLHGVDFKKGCYVGQEVVSRVEHRGTARKRVVKLTFEGDPPSIGTDITLDGVSIGTMGSTIEGLGLGLVRLDRAEEAQGRPNVAILAGSTPVRLDMAGSNPGR